MARRICDAACSVPEEVEGQAGPIADDLHCVRSEKARVARNPGHLVARKLVLQHLDFVIERDVQAPARILPRDVVLVPMGAAAATCAALL
jgi:hypothetical protein